MSSLSVGIKGLLSVFPVGALVAVVFWFVYVGRYSQDGPDPDGEQRRNDEKATIAFQAVVAVAALYFLLHHQTRVMMEM